MITLVGLCINFCAFLCLLYYAPDGRQAPPGVYYLNALALFLYQVVNVLLLNHLLNIDYIRH